MTTAHGGREPRGTVAAGFLIGRSSTGEFTGGGRDGGMGRRPVAEDAVGGQRGATEERKGCRNALSDCNPK